MDMSELIFGIFLITGTYVGSAVFAIVLFKLFFPLKAKPEKEHKLSYPPGEQENSSTKNTVPVLTVSGRRDWVKINT
jgi:hypothetical protein